MRQNVALLSDGDVASIKSIIEKNEYIKGKDRKMKKSTKDQKAFFISAKPVWLKEFEKEMNIFAGFRAVFDAPPDAKVFLRIAASSLYRGWLNGEFLCHGPARGPHGFYRVDEWDITGKIAKGKNLIAFEVAGYNINGFYLLDQPAFIQVEIVADGKVLASTNGKGVKFEAAILSERVRRVLRYSFMRSFTEVYELSEGYDNWRRNIRSRFNTESITVQDEKKLIERRIPCPYFNIRSLTRDVAEGTFATGIAPEKVVKDRSMTDIGTKIKGFKEEELAFHPWLELQYTKTLSLKEINQPVFKHIKYKIKSKSFHIFDFGTNLTGFIKASVSCKKNSRLLFTFDEILFNGDVDFKRLGCVNIVNYELKPGVYDIEFFEPYTMRYLKAYVFEGECDIEQIALREYANPDVYEAHFSCSDVALNRIFDAARETVKQNAVDIFMDCPSRERGGYLCDSFFTARTAFNINGHTIIEKAFYENYLLPKDFKYLPKGMLAMCYPSDHYDGVFIPNWGMWFIIQLEEYYQRSGDRKMVDALKSRVMALLDYFKHFKNSDGLLEKLENWVFIEWSEANKFVQDVSYPTNMLYAKVLDVVGRLYNIPVYNKEAKKIREVIRAQSFDGKFFVDNAIRKDGKLEVTTNRSEACQYYAFFFKVASPETHKELWETLVGHFGIKRKKTGLYPEVHMANAFIGNCLRFELLAQYGRIKEFLDEARDYFLPMAKMTGTLWENDHTLASCNHGFASHIGHIFYRSVLGVKAIDAINKIVIFRFENVPLSWCEGRIPVGKDAIALRWWKEDGTVVYKLDVPAGYEINIEKADDLLIKRV